MKEGTTGRLEDALCSSRVSSLDDFFAKNREKMIEDKRPFTEYMRRKMREKRISQKDILIAAGIPDKYGRKLISGETHTTERGKILRMCLGAHFDLEETQKALMLYGMAPLYARIPRDAVLIAAIGNGKYEVGDVDDLLIAQGEEPMKE